MKKKWINLKRRWRKMHKSDRKVFKGLGILIALNIAALPWVLHSVTNITWLLLLLWIHRIHVASLRKNTKCDLRRGAMHQWWHDRKRYNELSEQLISAEFSRDSLNSKYKKLEYDYRQLKKQVKSNDKKK